VAGVHVAKPSRNTRPVKIPAEVPPTGRLRPISLACAGLSAGGQLIAPVTKRSRVGGVHRRADHARKPWIRGADTVSLPAGKSASSAARAAISSSYTMTVNSRGVTRGVDRSRSSRFLPAGQRPACPGTKIIYTVSLTVPRRTDRAFRQYPLAQIFVAKVADLVGQFTGPTDYSQVVGMACDLSNYLVLAQVS